MLRQKRIGIFCALPSKQSVCIGNITVSFLGVSAIRKCEYVENFPDAIINCRVVAAAAVVVVIVVVNKCSRTHFWMFLL